jgi:formyl-CoA transferase
MQEAVANYLRSALARSATVGAPAARVGNGMASNPTAPCGIYPCAPGGPDDYVTIYVGRRGAGQAWPRLLSEIGREDLLEDARVSDPDARYEHREFVDQVLSEWTSRFTKDEVIDILGQAGIPCGAVLTTQDLLNDPSMGRMFRDVEHPRLGTLRVPAEPIHLSASTVEVRPPSAVGDDTEAVLAELAGYSAADLAALRAGVP